MNLALLIQTFFFPSCLLLYGHSNRELLTSAFFIPLLSNVVPGAVSMVDENGIFFTISYHRKGINLMTFLLALSTKKKI